MWRSAPETSPEHHHDPLAGELQPQLVNPPSDVPGRVVGDHGKVRAVRKVVHSAIRWKRVVVDDSDVGSACFLDDTEQTDMDLWVQIQALLVEHEIVTSILTNSDPLEDLRHVVLYRTVVLGSLTLS